MEVFDKGDDVAALLAAVTVKKLFLLADTERGRALGVERAEAGIIGSALPQSNVLADHIHQAHGLLNALQELGRNPTSSLQPSRSFTSWFTSFPSALP